MKGNWVIEENDASYEGKMSYWGKWAIIRDGSALVAEEND